MYILGINAYHGDAAAALDGWAGFYYAFQRMLAESLLSLYLIEADFEAATEPRRGFQPQPNDALAPGEQQHRHAEQSH